MKKNIITGLLIIVIMVTGFFIYNNFASAFKTDIPIIQNSDEIKTTDCKELEEEIKTMIGEANYCNQVSDCVIESRYYCPFGCRQLFNKDANLSVIDKKVEHINNVCGNNGIICEYECTARPETNVIECFKNKCSEGVIL